MIRKASDISVWNFNKFLTALLAIISKTGPAFFGFLLVFFPLLSQAKLLKSASSSDQKTTYYVELTGEESEYVIREFSLTEGELQKLVLEKKFSLRPQAEAFWKKENYDSWAVYQQKDSREIKFLNTQPLWNITQSWNTDWENKYREWVTENFDENFFVTYNIATDCADVAVALRWIFSRQEGLPVGNRLAGSGRLFSHESVAPNWMRLPTSKNWFEDQRFLAALDYVMTYTYTHSISQDSYPVEITHSGISQGTFLLTLFGDSGHTRILAEVNHNDPKKIPIFMYSSTVPKAIRPLYKEALFWHSQPESQDQGFRRMRWLESTSNGWRLKAKGAHPMYSLEQYSEDFQIEDESFVQALFRRLDIEFNPTTIVQAGIDDLTQSIQARIQIVQEGYEACKNIDCRPGTVGWENWSTPSRDARLIEKIGAVEFLVNSFSNLDPLTKEAWDQALKTTLFNIEDTSLSLWRIVIRFKNDLFSSDPRVEKDQRWALTGRSTAINISKKVQDVITLRNSQIPTADGPAACSPSCPYNSQRWLNLTTLEIDKVLLTQLAGWKIFCANEPHDECNQLINSLNNQSINTPIGRKSHGEILTISPWLNSDPNSPMNRRWGQHSPPKNQWIFLTNNQSLSVDQSKLALIGQNQVVDLNSHLSLQAPEGTKILHNVEGGYFLAYQSEPFRIWKLNTDQWKWESLNSEHLPDSSELILFLGTQHLLIEDKNGDSSLFKLEENFTLNWLKDFPKGSISLGTLDSAEFESGEYLTTGLFTDTDHRLKTFFVGSNGLQIKEFPTPKAIPESFWQTATKNSFWTLFIGSEKSWFLNKNTGLFKEVEENTNLENGVFQTYREGHQFVSFTRPDEIQFFGLNNLLTITYTHKFTNRNLYRIRPERDHTYLSFFPNSSRGSFAIQRIDNSGNKQTYQAQSNERVVMGVGDYVLTKDDNKHRLKDFSGSTQQILNQGLNYKDCWSCQSSPNSQAKFINGILSSNTSILFRLDELLTPNKHSWITSSAPFVGYQQYFQKQKNIKTGTLIKLSSGINMYIW